MLSSVPSDGVVIVADLEAGIGTLTRLDDEAVDATVVVVEPTPRSMDVAARAIAVAGDRRQGRIVVAANKVADADDERRVREAFADHELLIVPTDPVIDQADREGRSPIDVDPASPAVTAIESLAGLLQNQD
ncbi:MAG: hypothetical protein ACR2QO_17905 [Acidimicrobiales bacterium]